MASPAPVAPRGPQAPPPARPAQASAEEPRFPQPGASARRTDAARPAGEAGPGAPAPAPAGANGNAPAERGPETVAPERERQIADWAERRSDHSGGVLGIGGTDSSEKVRDALAGRSELGPLSPPEQRALAERMIDRWDAGRGDGASGPSRLVAALNEAPDSRAIVGERLAARAARISGATPYDPAKPDENRESRARADSYAHAAVAAAGPADDPASAGRLRGMTERLGPQGAAGFAQALSGPGVTLYGQRGADLSRALDAVSGGAPGEARSAFVQNAFAGTTASSYDDPGLQRAMGQALAREWHPDDPAAASRDGGRLAGILATDQGRRLLGEGGADGPALGTRVNALATVRADPAITGEALGRTDDPWTNPAIISPSAQAGAQQYLARRGDAAMALSGTDLDNTVGTAMGMPPAIPPGTDPGQAEAAAARGQFNYFGSGDAAEPVGKVADQIRAVAGGGPANVAVLPVTYSDGKTGPVQVPLFRVTDPSGTERYVDNTGRRYDDFEDWRTNNALPPGTQVYPEGGHLRAGEDGRVALGQGNTPKTVDTFGEHLTAFVDKAALVGGIVAGGVLIVGTGGLAAPVVAAAGAVAVGAGAWGAYRSGSELVDRGQHGQSLNPVTDAEARGLWLNLGASVASLGAFGSAARLARIGRAGEAVAPLEASLHGYAQAGSFALDAAATANQGVETARNWSRMSAGERASSILQMGFWGVSAGVGMRASGTRNPGDMFNPVKVRDNILAANPPPTAADPSLPGDAMKIDYDTATGVVRGIRHGPEATPADIALHQRTAQDIQRSLTLEGQVNRLFAGGDEPPPGTIGWAARADIAKVRERLDARVGELERPGLSPGRRAEIEEANAVDRGHLDDLSAEVSSLARDPARATIDARNSRRIPVDDDLNHPPRLKTAEDVRDARQKLRNKTVEVETEAFKGSWHLDGEGQLKVADLTISAPGTKRRSESAQTEKDLQSAVSREGGRGRSDEFKIVNERGKTVYDLTKVDDGGHSIGWRFFGDMGLANLFPQNARFNQQDFRILEDDIAKWLDAGAQVRYRVAVGDSPSFNKSARTKNGWGDDHRPDKVFVEYQVFRPGDPPQRIRMKTYEFNNDASARYRPMSEEFGATGAALQRLLREQVLGR
jgi:hypothetical protein